MTLPGAHEEQPGGSDDGGVESSVTGDGHWQGDQPPSPAQHLISKRLKRKTTASVLVWGLYTTTRVHFNSVHSLSFHGENRKRDFSVYFLNGNGIDPIFASYCQRSRKGPLLRAFCNYMSIIVLCSSQPHQLDYFLNLVIISSSPTRELCIWYRQSLRGTREHNNSWSISYTEQMLSRPTSWPAYGLTIVCACVHLQAVLWSEKTFIILDHDWLYMAVANSSITLNSPQPQPHWPARFQHSSQCSRQR